MVLNRHQLLIPCIFLFAAFVQSCGPSLSSEALEYYSQTEEVPTCTTEFTYSTGINVIAQAKFFKRTSEPVILDNKIKNMILSDPITEALPIPYAEVAVYTSSNRKLVQCGRTKLDGTLESLSGGDFTIPDTPQSYIIRVYARSNKTMPNKSFVANGAVKEDPYTNKVYYLETTFSSDGVNTSAINLIAYARQTEDLNIKGGAFNIYNNFIQSYIYLDENLTTVANSELECLSTKLSLFWKPGFNPYQYEYPEEEPATVPSGSYYNPNTDSLYITGGQLGDISLSNTDHFDDFATVHEIGHFIADQCGRLETPGGSHYIIVRVDGRLAWQEGWANYFGGVVTNARQTSMNPELAAQLASGTLGTADLSWSFLFNSEGFSDSVQNVGNGDGFLMDLKKPGTAPGEWQAGQYFGVPFDQVNPTLYPGEGHFREGAISRALFKMTVSKATLCSSCGSAVIASSPVTFDTAWQAFDAYGGLGDATNTTPNSNMFLENLKTLAGGDWTSNLQTVAEAEALHVFSDHNLASVSKKFVASVSATEHLTWVPYGQNLIQTACTKPTVIEARSDDPSLTGSNSDKRYSNHFYTIDPISLFGLDTLSVTFTKVNGTNTDHDLIIFEDDYVFNDDYLCSSPTFNGCSGTYSAQRSVNEYVVASNRASASTLSTNYTKSIANLLSKLDLTKRYILNIRAYTANKSISNVTSYKYSMTSNLGTLCPE